MYINRLVVKKGKGGSWCEISSAGDGNSCQVVGLIEPRVQSSLMGRVYMITQPPPGEAITPVSIYPWQTLGGGDLPLATAGILAMVMGDIVIVKWIG